MFIVREVFVAKPGMASRLARLFKETAGPRPNLRVMTDYIGPFNTVVMETEVKDLAAFEKEMQEYAERADVRERMAGYTEMYLTGRREVYRLA